jgi:hypothetical protein
MGRTLVPLRVLRGESGNRWVGSLQRATRPATGVSTPGHPGLDARWGPCRPSPAPPRKAHFVSLLSIDRLLSPETERQKGVARERSPPAYPPGMRNAPCERHEPTVLRIEARLPRHPSTDARLARKTRPHRRPLRSALRLAPRPRPFPAKDATKQASRTTRRQPPHREPNARFARRARPRSPHVRHQRSSPARDRAHARGLRACRKALRHFFDSGWAQLALDSALARDVPGQRWCDDDYCLSQTEDLDGLLRSIRHAFGDFATLYYPWCPDD